MSETLYSSPETPEENYSSVEIFPITTEEIRAYLTSRELSFGAMIADEAGRQLFGPILTDFVVGRAPAVPSEATLSAEDIKEQLTSQAAIRRERPKTYRVAKQTCVSIARRRSDDYPVIQTALELRKALEDYDALDIATDILSAMGALANERTIDMRDAS